MIAGFFVETDGAYFGLGGVDPWDIERDARKYNGPHPVVAHPPCQRWGRYWHGAPNKPNQYRLGEDGGCFAAALTAVRNYGGVLEHPAHSHAWKWHGIATPPNTGGWVKADEFGGWTCHVEQGHYGHMSRKATWLYAVGTERPELKWGAERAADTPGCVGKARLREGPPHWDDGNDWRQGQDADSERHAARVPRLTAGDGQERKQGPNTSVHLSPTASRWPR